MARLARLPLEPAPLHGAYSCESAKAQYAPLSHLQDADPTTRAHLARVITGTCGVGQNAYVTINNKAEGSAPLSMVGWERAFSKSPSTSFLLHSDNRLISVPRSCTALS